MASPSLRQNPNQIQENPEVNTRQTFEFFVKAIKYVWPFRVRFGLKAVMAILSLIPIAFFPWPYRIITDHVIYKVPIGDQPTPFPWFIQPFIDLVADSTPLQILFWVMVCQVIMMIFFGSFLVPFIFRQKEQKLCPLSKENKKGKRKGQGGGTPWRVFF